MSLSVLQVSVTMTGWGRHDIINTVSSVVIPVPSIALAPIEKKILVLLTWSVPPKNVKSGDGSATSSSALSATTVMSATDYPYSLGVSYSEVAMTGSTSLVGLAIVVAL